jgi:hypothetical protein
MTRDLPKARGNDAGLFRFVHLPAGTLRPTLSAPRLVASGVDPFTFWGDISSIELEPIELAQGERARRQVDLHEHWPGSLSVYLTASGAPRSNVIIAAIPEGSESGAASAGSTDDHGFALIPDLWQGMYRVEAHSPNSTWGAKDSNWHRVESGLSTELRFDAK